jgi:outer membrane biosynthesis protein TonB
MSQTSVTKTLLVALPVGMLLGIAGSVLAADPRLDEADGHIKKAIAALEAAENKDHKNKPFGGHRKAAIDHLKQAQKQIGKAKEFDDKDDKKDAGKPPDPKPDPKPEPPKPEPKPPAPKPIPKPPSPK